MMNKFEMMGKDVRFEISSRAQQQLKKRVQPLFIEMELYFSCLLRKQLRIRDHSNPELGEQVEKGFSIVLTDNLHISFRPVMTRSCSVSSCDGDRPPLSDFPIEKPQSYIPRWLKLDFRNGQWCGDFGY
jgi:hypothetical protein